MQRLLLSLVFTVSMLWGASVMATTMYSVGTFVPYFDKAQISDSGQTQKFSLTPYFSVGSQLQMTAIHYFMPELGYARWLETAEKVQKSMIFLHYNFSYIFSSNFIFRYGLTTHWYMIKGEGGTVRLRNGDGYTNFEAPDKQVTSYFTTLNLGGEYFFQQSLSTRFDLNMMNINEFENKSYNYLLTVNFYQ